MIFAQGAKLLFTFDRIFIKIVPYSLIWLLIGQIHGLADSIFSPTCIVFLVIVKSEANIAIVIIILSV